ncbi:hypothetical protein DASC09_004750 [Saccharomycopsis crataegensis]|uniref:Uncharacterized protein n=1 Tax=Saccharomycopsis crataegensis TaxID=43959 RepID=A0AAV5QFB1_9ASCO|nr:hypothetical protein DASC09_004750 [Saccharomycopsis crataegensis]
MFRQFNILATLARCKTSVSCGRRFALSNTRLFGNFNKPVIARTIPIVRTKLGASVLFGATAFTGGLLVFSNSPHVSNDVLIQSPPPGTYAGVSPETRQANKKHHKLSYDDLTYGSMFGLALGIIIGKLSYVLALISFTTFLSIEFLENRGIIQIPWNGILSLGTQRLNLRDFLLNNPSFKLAFFLSFIIAAWNV